MPASGSTLSRLNTLPALVGSAWLACATCAAKPTARAASTLSGSGFCRRHAAMAVRNSACCSGLNTRPVNCQIFVSASRQLSSMGRADSPKTFGCQCSSRAARITVTKTVMSSRLATAFGPEAMAQVSVPSAIFHCSTSARSSALGPRRSWSTPRIMRVENSSANRSSVCCTSTGSTASLFCLPGVTARTV